jgi:hypothetical protein
LEVHLVFVLGLLYKICLKFSDVEPRDDDSIIQKKKKDNARLNLKLITRNLIKRSPTKDITPNSQKPIDPEYPGGLSSNPNVGIVDLAYNEAYGATVDNGTCKKYSGRWGSNGKWSLFSGTIFEKELAS